MRITQILMLAALALAVRPASAAGQEAPRAPEPSVQVEPVPGPAVDPRLLVPAAQQRATLARTYAEALEMDPRDFSINGLIDYMVWGMIPGGVVGMVVAGATAEADLAGPAAIIIGAITGMGVGAAAGGVVYVVRRF